jgi:hypothetical protein
MKDIFEAINDIEERFITADDQVQTGPGPDPKDKTQPNKDADPAKSAETAHEIKSIGAFEDLDIEGSEPKDVKEALEMILKVSDVANEHLLDVMEYLAGEKSGVNVSDILTDDIKNKIRKTLGAWENVESMWAEIDPEFDAELELEPNPEEGEPEEPREDEVPPGSEDLNPDEEEEPEEEEGEEEGEEDKGEKKKKKKKKKKKDDEEEEEPDEEVEEAVQKAIQKNETTH